ncbi:hypothetical protein AB0M35_17980 [Micromonospora sp. NPDC051196]|uniref:hypothetical protein n=1 Tax=Micromonospora sp. NPDC051196 TaxID=3155281 RepID=UPI0034340263
MLTTTLLAAAEEPTRGWGGPIALGIAIAIYIAGATIHYNYRERRGLPSPTGEGDTDFGVNPQVTVVSDTDDTSRDTTGWWGRIVERDGRRVRAAGPPPDRDEAVHLDLVDEEPETIEDAIGRMLDRGCPYAEIVRQVMDEFEVSEATAKRRIRDVRAERIAAAS